MPKFGKAETEKDGDAITLETKNLTLAADDMETENTVVKVVPTENAEKASQTSQVESLCNDLIEVRTALIFGIAASRQYLGSEF